MSTAWEVAARVVDPELPMLTLADLGVLRDVAVDDAGAVVVTLTPTYAGCPALTTMRDDLVRALQAAGFVGARVRVSLTPPWTSDRISPAGRAALAAAGISPPGPSPSRATRTAPARGGPVPLRLAPLRRAIRCPRCRSAEVELTSEFGATACKALYRCCSCLEPFEHVKEV